MHTGLPFCAVPDGPLHVRVRGRRLLYFGGSDYFRLAWHAEIRRHLAQAIRAGGVDAASSRVTTGNLPVYEQAERALARWMGARSAVLTASGYTAPIVAAQAVASRCDGAVLGSGAHPCLRDAAAVSGLATEEAATPEGLSDICRRKGWNQPLFLCGGVGPLNGRFQPLPDWLAALPPDGIMLFDDAHGVGTLGRRGRGPAEGAGLADPRVIVAFTLSKAFGLYGGVVTGPDWLAASVWKESRAARGGTPIPPAYASAVPVALGLSRNHGTQWRQTLTRHRLILQQAFNAVGDAAPEIQMNDHVGPVFGLAVKDALHERRLSRALRSAGIEPPFIQYPGGPEAGLFRFSLSSAHPTTALRCLAEVIADVCQRSPGGFQVL